MTMPKFDDMWVVVLRNKGLQVFCQGYGDGSRGVEPVIQAKQNGSIVNIVECIEVKGG